MQDIKDSINFYERIISVILRLFGALAKFVFFLYIAKNLNTSEVGEIGIIFSIILIGIVFIGAELHYINSRDIASSNFEEISKIIVMQLKSHIIFYLLTLPILFFLFKSNILNDRYFVYIYFLLISEHITQEIARFLQFTFKPVLASFIIFLRNALWIIVIILFTTFQIIELNIFNILGVWVTFSTFTAAIGLFLIREYLILHKNDHANFLYKNMISILKKAFPFFITALFFIISQNLDRFVLNKIIGISSVGIFFFLSSLASVLILVVTYGVNVFYAPHAISSFKNSGYESYIAIKKTFIRQTIIFSLIGIIVASIIIDPVLLFVGQDEYIENTYIFYLMLLSNFILLCSDFFNLDMYVRNMDKQMMFASVLGLIVALIFSITFVSFYGLKGAPIAYFLSMLSLLLIRYLVYKNEIRKNPYMKYKPKNI